MCFLFVVRIKARDKARANRLDEGHEENDRGRARGKRREKPLLFEIRTRNTPKKHLLRWLVFLLNY